MAPHVKRTYAEVSASYAPFTYAVLQGVGGTLGATNPTRSSESIADSAPGDDGNNGWPRGRSYVGIAHFRAPYDEFGYFQDNTLQGLGAVSSDELTAAASSAPGAVKRFLLSGEPVSPLRENVTLPFNQVHPYVYGGIAVAALVTSYLSYKAWKKTHKQQGI